MVARRRSLAPVLAVAVGVVACAPAAAPTAAAPTPAAPTAPGPAAVPPATDAPLPAPDAAGPDETRGTVIVHETDECGLVIDQIYFEPGSAKVSPRQLPLLDATATMFRCFQRTGEITKWQVVGNTDAAEADPEALSLARARTVAAELSARGVDDATLEITGAGTTQPIDQRRTAAARAKNRRVFFLVLERGAGSP